jgi:predicted nucleic acid-binding protein
VANPPVVNASPLILMARAGVWGLLRVLGDSVLVPTAVAEEIQRRGSDDPTVQAMKTSGWLTLVQSPSIPPSIASWDLGPGESAVLAWAAANPGTEIVCDDLAARRCAQTLGIDVCGTLAIVLRAKQHGLIEEARPLIQRLVEAGMYLSRDVLDQALALVGE